VPSTLPHSWIFKLSHVAVCSNLHDPIGSLISTTLINAPPLQMRLPQLTDKTPVTIGAPSCLIQRTDQNTKHYLNDDPERLMSTPSSTSTSIESLNHTYIFVLCLERIYLATTLVVSSNVPDNATGEHFRKLLFAFYLASPTGWRRRL
jgi:hypothetical protein